MTWRSPFADGPCTVRAVNTNGTLVFDAELAAGVSREFSDPDQPESTFVVAVSAGGIVSLSGPQYGGARSGWEVDVVPATAPETAMQVSGIAADVSSAAETNAIMVFGSLGADDAATDLTIKYGRPSTGTPDPCPIPDPQPGVKPSLWGVYAEMTGI